MPWKVRLLATGRLENHQMTHHPHGPQLNPYQYIQEDRHVNTPTPVKVETVDNAATIPHSSDKPSRRASGGVGEPTAIISSVAGLLEALDAGSRRATTGALPHSEELEQIFGDGKTSIRELVEKGNKRFGPEFEGMFQVCHSFDWVLR